MIEESYDCFPFNNKTQFFFESTGLKGRVVKVVVFMRMEGNRWNVGFGDVREGRVDDTSFTNNNDVRKVLSTVAKTIYQFSEIHPEKIIVIVPRDERRKHFYNAIFKRYFSIASEVFDIFGILAEDRENYLPEKTYDSFELLRKFEA
ncbi:MAG: hypothetical protein H7246_19295 [Phycisphaerae bacterium]|nr:hypothetical protein [Saprospiraceae bacterium]